MKVLFLDIDGVLNGWKSTKNSFGFDDECVKAFQPIIKIPGLKIVVSSSWRLMETPENLVKILEENVGIPKGMIIGQTPNLAEAEELESGHVIWHGFTREDEIQAWLNKHPEVESFVVLDDLSMKGLVGDNLVQITSADGLTQEKAQKIIEKLR
jgi:hypothetical protein